MAERWEALLDRWIQQGLIDPRTGNAIRDFERSREEPHGLRWPILIALGLGGVMLAAGMLLFVAAHWDEMSPANRFSLVIVLVAGFHIAGALITHRFGALAMVLHGLGTVALGAGIYLAAQIFNLQEHWPQGVLLWAIGAWLGVVLRRDWVQVALASLLSPAWVACEWVEATRHFRDSEQVLGQGLLLLAVTYLTAFFPGHASGARRVLAWLGGISLIPATVIALPGLDWASYEPALPTRMLGFGLAVGIVLPLVLAVWLRRRSAWINAVTAFWVIVLGSIPVRSGPHESLFGFAVRELGPYVWCGVAALGLIAWGVREQRRERINLGVAGFGITIIAFYFSHVMDMLSRSASLVGFGVLFLVLGWSLEKTRRRLVARVTGATA